MCLAICWLGFTLVRRERPATAFNMSGLGAPVIGMGLWPLSFPVLERTPVFWVGGWVAGLLHLTVGFGMALVLVNESAATVRQQNEELRALDRMKGNFLSMVSHELRTPLMALTGYLELLADGFAGPVNPDQREYIANIEAASLQLSSLVESLLDTMQAEVGTLRVQREETDPMVILDRTVASMRVIAAKRGIVVETIRPGNLPPIVADAERVGQILSNIIGNSLKFSEKGTSITVAANVEGGQLVVRISDQGIGVPQEALELIFQPFYQVDNTLTRVRGGTGLGLAISRSLAQAMDGKLVAESTPGVGTTFTLSLPLSEVESLAAEPVAVSAT
jgi:signal transduction histidine kinase